MTWSFAAELAAEDTALRSSGRTGLVGAKTPEVRCFDVGGKVSGHFCGFYSVARLGIFTFGKLKRGGDLRRRAVWKMGAEGMLRSDGCAQPQLGWRVLSARV